MEIWQPIPDYESAYEVSSYGRVRSIDKLVKSGLRHNQEVERRGKILKQNMKRNGYMTVDLSSENRVRTSTVHRIVAKVFIPNTENKPQVNHKNGNKSDNRVENLEWVTAKENMVHRYTTLGHIGKRKPVICIETSETHGSSYEAATWLNSSRYGGSRQVMSLSRKIRQCCVNERKIAYGFHWKYTD